MAPISNKNKKLIKPAVKEIVVGKKQNSKVISGQLAKKLKKNKNRSKPAKGRGVVFIRHLPHGFFEDQLKRFFEQFGEVTRLRLARSERTGGSKGYAFVEFEVPEVAEIAAETMDNYLMFQRIVKAVYIPPEKQKYNYFKSSIRKVINKSGKELFVSGHTARLQKVLQKHNDWTVEVYKTRTDRQLEKIKKLKKKYANADFDFESIIYNPNNIDMDEGKPDSSTVSENKELTPGSILLVKKTKTGLAAKRSDDKTKKTKKEINLKMLMEQSLKDEYTSDEDFEIDSDDIVKAIKNSNKATKKSKKEIDLKMLLQKSLNEDEDSSDEEFIADEHELDNDTDSEGSNEESYDIEFSKDSETDDDSREDEQVSSKKSGNGFVKESNLPKVNRLEQLIRRKPHLGGIQKYSKKTLTGKKSAQTGNSKIKTQLKAEAVKELQKQGNIKQMKVADLKSKKNKKKTK